MAQGQCPTVHEQVTLEGVASSDVYGGYRDVEGFVLNNGSTRIADDNGLYVRVRFFDANHVAIAEQADYLRTDRNFCCIEALDPQQRRPFWVQFEDGAIENWSYFQVVAFEVAERSVLCSGCTTRHYRQEEQVTIETALFTMFAPPGYGDDEFPTVEGYVKNSGSVRLAGSLYVRVRFFDANQIPITEHSNALQTDSNFCCIEVLDPQRRRPFWVSFIGYNNPVGNWSYFQVVSFENDETRVPCLGCDRLYPR